MLCVENDNRLMSNLNIGNPQIPSWPSVQTKVAVATFCDDSYDNIVPSIWHDGGQIIESTILKHLMLIYCGSQFWKKEHCRTTCTNRIRGFRWRIFSKIVNKMHGALHTLHVSLNNASTRTVSKWLKRNNDHLITLQIWMEWRYHVRGATHEAVLKPSSEAQNSFWI